MQEQVDVVIVGSGVAGLFCALHLPQNQNVLVITKDEIRNSDSYLAQGGISTLKNNEDYNAYFEDTLRAGRYKNNPLAVEVMIKESPSIIEELIAYGVQFDRKGQALSYTREGAHSTSRILHHKDQTGKEMTEKLLQKVTKAPNIHLREYTTMYDLVIKEGMCKGIIVKNQDGELQAILADKVVWATGGVGGLFEHSTNFAHLTGDSLAIALKRNIKMQDLQAVQIHPTALYTQKKERCFLISEAVRGEGAILLGANKKRFVEELLARDTVTLAIQNQMNKDQKDYVYLDIRGLGKDKILARFPAIYQKCKEEGYDITRELLPVTPAQHYFMGGVQIDLEGRTSMKNLFAIGETSCNGVHGANRLASNSLLESLVFAKRAAKALIKEGSFSKKAPLFVDLRAYTKVEDAIKMNQSLIIEEIKRKDGFKDDERTHTSVCG